MRVRLPERLETARLRLRRPRVEDAPHVFARWASDPEVTRFLTWAAHGAPAETEAWLELVDLAWEATDGHRAWLIERREGGGPIGSIGATVDGHRVEIGYALERTSWGQGLMSEAAREVALCVAALAGVHRVGAIVDVDNRASARVLEKIGMRFEGVLERWVKHPALGAAPRDVRSYVLPSWTSRGAPERDSC